MYKVTAIILTANTPRRFMVDPFIYWFVNEIPPAANVDMIFDDGSESDAVPATTYRRGKLEKEGKFITVESDVTGLFVLVTAMGDQIFDTAVAAGGPSGAMDVNIVSPLNSADQVETGGPQPAGHIGPLTDYDNPNVHGFLNDLGGGAFRLDNFQGHDNNLFVAGRNFIFGFIAGGGSVIDTIATKCLLISFDPAGAGDLTFLNQDNQPLPILSTDGRLVTMGALSDVSKLPGGIGLVPCAGTTSVTISADASWGVRIGQSTETPGVASPARLARQFFSIAGVLAAGATLAVTNTAGKKIKVYGYCVSLASADDFNFEDQAAALLSCKGQQITNGAENSESPLFETTGNLHYRLTAGATGSIQIRYEIE